MDMPFFEDWNQKRLDKIIKIFGKNWFFSKKILELGACHGNVGLELIKLGALVYFTDARQENLNRIKEKNIRVLDQNYPYDLKMKFDLIIHMGVLNHLENWKQDLKCALSHSDKMILESLVLGKKQKDYCLDDNKNNLKYSSFNSKNSYFTQESVEKEIKKIGFNFIRMDDKNLNSYSNTLNLIYDWTYEEENNNFKIPTMKRRMWLVTKNQLPKQSG
jgi:hypothetical protein